MKKSNIIALSAGLVAIVAVIGIAISTFAQDATSDTALERPYRMHFWDELSDSAQAEIQTLWETKRAEREAQQEKIEAAFDQGYDAWVTAIKEAQGEDAPILSQVNADNFARYREAHNYMEQARENREQANEIFDELGIRQRGFGKGDRHGMHGFMKPMGGFGGVEIQ